MGADLISYIAFGPCKIKLDERRKLEVVRKVRAYLDACIHAAEMLLLGNKDVPAPRPGPIEARCSHTLRLEGPPELPTFKSMEELKGRKDYRDLVKQTLDACGYCVEAEHAFAHDSSRPSHRAQDAADAFDKTKAWLLG